MEKRKLTKQLEKVKKVLKQYNTVDVHRVFRDVRNGFHWTLVRVSNTKQEKPLTTSTQQCKEEIPAPEIPAPEIPTPESKPRRRTVYKPRGPLASIWVNQYY